MKKILFLLMFFAFEVSAHLTSAEKENLDKVCLERNELWQMRDCVRKERDECFVRLQICCQYEFFDCRNCMNQYDDCVWAKAQVSACVPESKKAKTSE